MLGGFFNLSIFSSKKNDKNKQEELKRSSLSKKPDEHKKKSRRISIELFTNALGLTHAPKVRHLASFVEKICS